jgi:hypothetical protein
MRQTLYELGRLAGEVVDWMQGETERAAPAGGMQRHTQLVMGDFNAAVPTEGKTCVVGHAQYAGISSIHFRQFRNIPGILGTLSGIWVCFWDCCHLGKKRFTFIPVLFGMYLGIIGKLSEL